jgi:protoporphyrinogen oxidase
VGKFGSHYKDISLAWFWARIKARTTQLGYPNGGFQRLADIIAESIVGKGGKISYTSTVRKITQSDRIKIEVDEKGKIANHSFDRLLVTLPNLLFSGITPELPQEYKKSLREFDGIGAVNMVLELSRPFLKDSVYWLNICEREFPFLAVVEHTHFIDKIHYDNRHIVYVGNYLPHGHAYFSMKPEELLAIYDPFLRKISPDYKNFVLRVSLFKVPFAQPIVTRNFSEKILPFATPLHGIFLANMQQVYPWDRGTNFAVEMGKKVAQEITVRKKSGTIG